jgi:ribosomal protein S18 acetylase RimI-like enzyme
MTASAYDILFYENTGHSPAWPLVPHAMIELEVNDFDFQPHVAPAWSDPCMAALDRDGKAIAFLIYRYDEVKCCWFIILAWVTKERRRQGIHTAMFKALVARATKRDDILSIDCGTHVNNLTAQSAFESQGRLKVAIMYSLPLRAWLAGKEPTDVP